MKIKLLIKLLFIVLIFSCGNDSNNEENENMNIICGEGNIADETYVIIDEESKNSFLSNNFSELNNLIVYNQSDLSFLKCIEKIQNLKIEYCAIENFEDLENILEIGSIEINFCENLLDFSGLESLESLNHLYIENCNSLINLSGLESLNVINVALLLDNNSDLANLEGLNNLENVQGIEISDCTSLIDITALNNINNSSIEFSITNCDSLVNLGLFNNIENLGGLFIVGCSALEQVNCFPNITTSGPIYVNDCSVENISFPNLVSTHYLSIRENPNLTNINFTSLVEFAGGSNGDFSMMMDYNENLENLDGFVNLTYNIGIISINPFSTNDLRNVCGLRNLILEQINSGSIDNEVRFNASCFGNSGGGFSDISQFDSICDCN